MQFAAAFQAIVNNLLAEHGMDVVFTDIYPPLKSTYRGFYVNTSHTFYREFYGEATQIEKRPELIVLDASAYQVVYEDMSFTMLNDTYKTDGPIWTQAADDGTIIYVVYPIYRF